MKKTFKSRIMNRLRMYLPYIYPIVSKKFYLRLLFYSRTGRILHLNPPLTFNEKLQWLKINDIHPEYTKMVDKIDAKEYVKCVIGDDVIIPTLGIWNSVEDIEWETLPHEFVIKVTGDSGSVVVCKDKSKLNIEDAQKKLLKGWGLNYSKLYLEYQYKNIRQRIIAEKLLKNGQDGAIWDYKVMCFNGIAKLIQLHKNRGTSNYSQDIYNRDWTMLSIEQEHCPPSNIIEKKPKCLEQMLFFSEKLAQGIPFIRVDWYVVDEHLYFGELTFFDASGFDEFIPNKWNKIIGDWIKLPES